MEKNKIVSFTSKFTDFQTLNSEFTKCKCYALATGDNANGNDITTNAVDIAISRGEFYNKPIVAHLYKDEDGNFRVGGHDSKVVISNDGIEFIDETIPFGTIPESSNIRKEEVLEPDGITVNTYVVMDVILWTGRYNIMDAAYGDEIYFNQSCELYINACHFKDNGILAIDDFTFEALCLLNKSDDDEKNVRPCFASCRVEKLAKFSMDNNKFKENYTLLLGNLNKVSIDNKDVEESEGEMVMNFTAITESLSVETFKNNAGEDVAKYKVLDVKGNKIFALDMEDYKPYSLDYAVVNNEDSDASSVVIDFESKTEMSLSATDKIELEGFEEFSIDSEIEKVVPTRIDEKVKLLKAEYDKDIDELSKSLEELNSKYEIAMGELASYKEKERVENEKKAKKEMDELFNKYSAKLGKCAEFLVYKANVNPSEVSIEEANEKLTLMLGRHMMNKSGKVDFSYNPTEASVSTSRFTDVNEELTKRYGHLLDKYI